MRLICGRSGKVYVVRGKDRLIGLEQRELAGLSRVMIPVVSIKNRENCRGVDETLTFAEGLRKVFIVFGTNISSR